MIGQLRGRLLYLAPIVWLLFTVALAIWWLIFGLRQAQALGSVGGPAVGRLDRVERMLVWEGLTFIVLLVAGGLALVLSIRRERTRLRSVEAFFTAFTHDLKTALTGLQLQAESLREDLGATVNPNLRRLLENTLRLGVQLDNSLYFAQPDGRLLAEPVRVAAAIAGVAQDWPELAVTIEGDAVARADTRAFGTILRNVFQNAVVHGGATRVAVRVATVPGAIAITMADNGGGAPPEVVGALGWPFSRSGPSSGSGIGWFISRQLADRMGGRLRPDGASGSGFTAVLELPPAT